MAVNAGYFHSTSRCALTYLSRMALIGVPQARSWRGQKPKCANGALTHVVVGCLKIFRLFAVVSTKPKHQKLEKCDLQQYLIISFDSIKAVCRSCLNSSRSQSINLIQSNSNNGSIHYSVVEPPLVLWSRLLDLSISIDQSIPDTIQLKLRRSNAYCKSHHTILVLTKIASTSSSREKSESKNQYDSLP